MSIHQPQVAFLDHVFGVVDAGTAEAIADSSFLAGFGRLSVAATVADTGTWTGR